MQHLTSDRTLDGSSSVCCEDRREGVLLPLLGCDGTILLLLPGWQAVLARSLAC